ncbi:DUF2239 family protein [Sphaerotilus microaerophilus]|uniref:DUF2239 family protein n=1 Tax=Sphaerotilus microaerophilus TaxID=2914710 RepID=A0ABM7YML2_9BURK|nr:DUF2239 family protein [Sphaerotilus sp. FB-5]BDI05704.1 hypothetical protein CATMQ487_26740 [Sphaerotilus sp. FB-5]
MNTPTLTTHVVAFTPARSLWRSGPLAEVALALHALGEAHPDLLVLDDGSGRVIDLDLRGSADDVLARLAPSAVAEAAPTESAGDADTAGSNAARGRGRPRLGVVPREVTLLPRHWDWLGSQPGGASVVLRRLVEDARRASAEADRARQAVEAAYQAMSTLASHLAGFEEASRALFAHDLAQFTACIAAWPEDLRSHLVRMAQRGLAPADAGT